MIMSNLFDFVQINSFNVEGTANYELKFHEQCTVKKFIDEIISSRSKEWGVIRIMDSDEQICAIAYELGKVNNSIPQNLSLQIITVAIANGAYTRMDYVLYVRQETNSTYTEDIISKAKDVIISDEKVVYSKWKINCDGYYPYCANCMEEPKGGMSKYCPNCGAKMCLED
jgi:hypothetical protein